MTIKKKLIEVALPLDAINSESLRRKQKAPKGFPTSFHKWWAQRPLAACRAVVFASIIDDPSAHPTIFTTKEEQALERERLLDMIRELIKWENSDNEYLLSTAFEEIRKSTDGNPPTLWDPFCGSGSIPLEAQRLGIESYASDLNPVSVLINKGMIEIPYKFSGQTPINPDAKKEKTLFKRKWNGGQGIAEDVRYYSNWMFEKAEQKIGHLYPKLLVTEKMAEDRPDLKQYVGQKLTVTAWIWARTVKSPNPAFANIEVPLASSFMLSSKKGKEVYVEPLIESDGYHFKVKIGIPNNLKKTKEGTGAGKRNAFFCLMSGAPIDYRYIRTEGKAGRMGQRLMAIVAEGTRGRVYISPTSGTEGSVKTEPLQWRPDTALPDNPRDFKTPNYGMSTFADLFTTRQLVTWTTFSSLISEIRTRVKNDALNAGMRDDEVSFNSNGTGALAYADSICVYMACIIDRMIYYGSSLTTWLPKDNALRDCMPRQALAMTWDFAESNPFGKSSGDIITCANSIANYLDIATPREKSVVLQCDARAIDGNGKGFLFSTDPPYYDNIGYADLSDYFYVWLRRSLKYIFPNLFATVASPKAEELVATPYRHGSKDQAEAFFLLGMTQVMQRLADQSDQDFPITIYYAFKQEETDKNGTTSTGWETFLEAVINANLKILGTWPLRTEGAGRMIAKGTNALASSIVLVCRPREKDAKITTRREFVATLKAELPVALTLLQRGNIAPVDLAQAAIGPGMAVFTRFAKVLDAAGNSMTVHEALSMINQTLDETLSEQEGDFDADSRWALAWFEQFGFADGEFGVAEVLSKAKVTSIAGMVEAGIIVSKGGKVRLLQPDELPADWDPNTDKRLTAWEMVHHLIRVLEEGGEPKAAELVAKLGAKAETARELAYRLYMLCERKKRAAEALSYNGLVQSWPEIERLAREQETAKPKMHQQPSLPGQE